MLAGVAGGAGGYLAGYMLVAILPSSTLEGAILLGIVSGGAESGSAQVVMNAVTGRSLEAGLDTALLSGAMTGGVGGTVGTLAGRTWILRGRKLEYNIAPHAAQTMPRRELNLFSHHGIQDAWARDHSQLLPGYDSDKAPTLLLQHAKHVITYGRQNVRGAERVAKGLGKWASTFQQERAFLIEDLKAADVPEWVIKEYAKEMDRFFGARWPWLYK